MKKFFLITISSVIFNKKNYYFFVNSQTKKNEIFYLKVQEAYKQFNKVLFYKYFSIFYNQ